MSLIRSMPGSLPRSLVGSIPSGALPWEDAGGGTSQTASLLALVSLNSGEWWSYRRPDLITIATGVSQWTGCLQAKTLTQGTGSKQPTYSASTGLTFAKASVQSLVGAANFLQAKPGYTTIVFGSAAGNADEYIWAYGVVNNDAGIFMASTPGLAGYMRSGAGVMNKWTTGLTTPFGLACYASQGQWADGATGQKQLFKDGSQSTGGSRNSASDVSAGSFPAGNMSLGAYIDGIASPGDCVIRHLIVFPSQVAASVITQANTMLHSIEGA